MYRTVKPQGYQKDWVFVLNKVKNHQWIYLLLQNQLIFWKTLISIQSIRRDHIFAHIEREDILNMNPLSANRRKWSDTLKQFVPTNCLSVFDHFLRLALKGLKT